MDLVQLKLRFRCLWASLFATQLVQLKPGLRCLILFFSVCLAWLGNVTIRRLLIGVCVISRMAKVVLVFANTEVLGLKRYARACHVRSQVIEAVMPSGMSVDDCAALLGNLRILSVPVEKGDCSEAALLLGPDCVAPVQSLSRQRLPVEKVAKIAESMTESASVTLQACRAEAIEGGNEAEDKLRKLIDVAFRGRDARFKKQLEFSHTFVQLSLKTSELQRKWDACATRDDSRISKVWVDLAWAVRRCLKAALVKIADQKTFGVGTDHDDDFPDLRINVLDSFDGVKMGKEALAKVDTFLKPVYERLTSDLTLVVKRVSADCPTWQAREAAGTLLAKAKGPLTRRV